MASSTGYFTVGISKALSTCAWRNQAQSDKQFRFLENLLLNIHGIVDDHFTPKR